LTAEYNVGCCIGYQGHDTSASAAFAFRTIPELDGVVDILSWWTFTDVSSFFTEPAVVFTTSSFSACTTTVAMSQQTSGI
jgi:hypothetical protein